MDFLSGVDFKNGELKAFGEYVNRIGSTSRLTCYGHSLPYGGSLDPDEDIITHIASLLGAREITRATPGAVLHWPQSTILGDGGWAYVLQNEARKSQKFASTTLSAQATVGASTISVASGTGIANNSQIFVGIGASGATGGELLYVTAGGGTTTLTVQRPTGETTTARTHLNGEPVYVVPTGWISSCPYYIFWYGINDLGASPWTSQLVPDLQKRFTEPLKAMIARARCTHVFENDHKSCIYAGTWAADTVSRAANSGESSKATATVNSTVDIHVTDNLEAGSTVVVGMALHFAPVLSIEWRVDGTLVETQVVTADIMYTNKVNHFCRRFTGLAAGRHTIQAKLSAYTAGTLYMDWWGVEAPVPPVVAVVGLNRPGTYLVNWPNGATWLNGQTNRTLTAQENVGATTIDLSSSTGAIKGSTVVFEPGTGNEERREVLTVPNGTSITVAATGIQHANGSAVRIGMQDADIALANTLIQNVVNEFDSSSTIRRVHYVEVDDLIGTDVTNFLGDRVHYSAKGASILTERFYAKLMSSNGYTPRTGAYAAVPTAPLPCIISFGTSQGSAPSASTQAWVNMASGLTELYGAAAHRKLVDLRRAYEAMFAVGVQVAGASGAGLRIQYSLDYPGTPTTWKYLFRTSAFAEDTTHEAILTSTGMKNSAFMHIAAEALANNVWLRVIGINGNGTADPVFGTIDLVVR